jgi:hypothetical protein
MKLKYFIKLILILFVSTKAYSSGFIQIEYCELKIDLELISQKVIDEINNDTPISPKVTLKKDLLFFEKVCSDQVHMFEYIINYCLRVNDTLIQSGNMIIDSVGNVTNHNTNPLIITKSLLYPKAEIDKRVKKLGYNPNTCHFIVRNDSTNTQIVYYFYRRKINRNKIKNLEIDAFTGEVIKEYIFDYRDLPGRL